MDLTKKQLDMMIHHPPTHPPTHSCVTVPHSNRLVLLYLLSTTHPPTYPLNSYVGNTAFLAEGPMDLTKKQLDMMKRYATSFEDETFLLELEFIEVMPSSHPPTHLSTNCCYTEVSSSTHPPTHPPTHPIIYPTRSSSTHPPTQTNKNRTPPTPPPPPPLPPFPPTKPYPPRSFSTRKPASRASGR